MSTTQELQSEIDALDFGIRATDIAIAQSPGYRDLRVERYLAEKRRKELLAKLREVQG